MQNAFILEKIIADAVFSDNVHFIQNISGNPYTVMQNAYFHNLWEYHQ